MTEPEREKRESRAEETRNVSNKTRTGRDRERLYKVNLGMTSCVVMTESMTLRGEELHHAVQTWREGGEAGREQLERRESKREAGWWREINRVAVPPSSQSEAHSY